MECKVESIEKLIADGRKFLWVAGDRVYLATAIPPDVDRAMLSIDLEKAYRRAQLLAGDQKSWSLAQIAVVAGASYKALEDWEKAEVINSGARRGRGKAKEYTFADFFACAILGDLRRCRTGLTALRKVYRLLTGRDQVDGKEVDR